jgi:TolB-like protein/DNA-binding winged helix-turn-helix (wHTH) protein
MGSIKTMSSSTTPPDIRAEEPFRVADSIVDAAGNRLLRGSREIRLEPKVTQVLMHLAMNRGQVVSRNELERAVWTGMVVGYDAITNAIIKLRRALGDDPRSPHVIETISKHGYRLIADVGPAAIEDAAVPSTRAPTRAPPRQQTWLRIGLLAAAVLILTMAGSYVLFVSQERARPGPEAVARPSIAVLPFDSMAADPEREYFANGLTEDLITDLSKVPGLLVVARNSVFAYKGSDAAPDSIARDLGVGFLLRGSVRRDDRKLRLNARLIDARNGQSIWAERYDRELTDIFRIQDELAARIVFALQLELAPEEQRRLAAGEAVSVAAYDELLRGLDHYGRRSFEDNELAKAHFRRAIELDPDYARAYAALALAWSRDAVDGWAPMTEAAMARAQTLVAQAVRLDPEVPQIYFIRAQLALYRGDHAEAIRQTEHAIALAPGYADAHAQLAWVLHFAGRPARGLRAMDEATRLNPRVPSIYRLVRGALHYAQGEDAEAISDLEQAVPMNPTFQMLRLWLAAAYAASGRIEDAQWQADELMALNPSFSLAHIQRVYPIRDPRYRERLLADLRKAGL